MPDTGSELLCSEKENETNQKRSDRMRMKFANPLAVTLALFLLVACGGKQLKVEPIAATGNPGELVNQLDSEVSAARQKQFNVLSPEMFAQAEKNLASAKQGLQKGSEISVILARIAEARAQLREAGKNADMAKANLSQVIKAREEARAAGATIFEEDYSQAEQSFLDLTKAVEDHNLNWAQKNQARSEERFRTLELRAIKVKTLGDVRKTIDQAAKEGAKKLAPELYDASNKELQAVDAFISKNPHKKEERLAKAATALFNAQRLLEQTRLRAKLKEMNPTQTALWMEEMLSKMTNRLSAPDMRNQPVTTQMANIVGTIDSVLSDREFLGEQVKTLQVEKAECQKNFEEKWASESRLASEKQAAEQRLAAERRFNKMYTEVQGFFDKDEAEVYKQGNQLVIRMRGIRFPVGQAVIMPENYGLLSKVQKAVRTFGNPTVVIEGHTDSTGSAATNDLLSQQRAESVKEYLVANQTLAASKISAVGFGSNRPLASNKTQQGRAINRRIDIIISPASLNL